MQHEPSRPPLLVVGAGPKALALAAKSLVLRTAGFDVPEVVAVERDRTAANWREGHGWTDGAQRLGTHPEKDLGFPYRSDGWQGRGRYVAVPAGAGNDAADDISRSMIRFSWLSHLVEQGQYAEWVDRGRPQPTHRQWVAYLEWAAAEMGAPVVRGEVREIELDGDAWQLTFSDGSGRHSLRGCGVVVTGPGPLAGVIDTDGERLLDTADFWRLAPGGPQTRWRRVVVIGAGETAGSVVRELTRSTACAVTVVTPGATLFSRGESYFENRYYSDPSHWRELSEHDRREFIRRTDRAVFSADVQRQLGEGADVSWRSGRVSAAGQAAAGVEVALTYHGRESVLCADAVIDATGGDPLWFTEVLGPRARTEIETALGGRLTRERLEASVGPDLAIEGVRPHLHLPNLAALAQGPGFPNLSCLGLLSDRILAGHAPSRSTAGASAGRGSAGIPQQAKPWADQNRSASLTEGVSVI